jgi:simple sugar transport system permease protein
VKLTLEIILIQAIVVSILAATFRLATPIMLAALGEIIAESAGVLNLGVEGIMLMGAFMSFWITYSTGNLWLGVFIGVFIGCLMGFLMAFLSVTLGLDQVLCGMGLYFLGLGLSGFFYRVIFGVRTTPPIIEGIKDFPIPFLSQIPIIGPILFNQDILVYLTYVLLPFSVFIVYKTTFGLKIRAVGENPRASDTLGINVYFIQYICTIIGGALAALGGAYLSLAHLHTFWEGMTLGRGFIAVALVYFGKWHPYRTFVGALIFGWAYAFQMWLQAEKAPVPYQILLMFPYILTLIVLALVSRKARGPASLAIPYKRE